MKVFDGTSLAAKREQQLAATLVTITSPPTVAAVVFSEDSGGQLYTNLKQAAAQRLGMAYQPHEVSLSQSSEVIRSKILELAADPAIAGIIIQKPRRLIWQKASLVAGEPTAVRKAFASWWQFLTSALPLGKDIDGLHPETLAAVKAGTWQDQGLVLPATAKAVMTIIETEKLLEQGSDKKIVVLGRSDIVGLPVFYELKNQGFAAELWGSKDFNQTQEQGRGLKKFQLVIAATGRHKLVTADHIEAGTALIDVGEPRPDVDQQSVAAKASFVTPVPGGVGPLTVISLMENVVQLAAQA